MKLRIVNVNNKIRHNQKLELKITNNIKVKTITMNNNENMTD